MNKEDFEKIMKEMQDLLNADHDYSELSNKAKNGTLTSEELEIFTKAFDEMAWRLKRIDELTNSIKSI